MRDKSCLSKAVCLAHLYHVLSSLHIQFPNDIIAVMQGFPPESFEYILLDAPCSALGLRPRLSHHTTILDLMQVFPLRYTAWHECLKLFLKLLAAHVL